MLVSGEGPGFNRRGNIDSKRLRVLRRERHPFRRDNEFGTELSEWKVVDVLGKYHVACRIGVAYTPDEYLVVLYAGIVGEDANAHDKAMILGELEAIVKRQATKLAVKEGKRVASTVANIPEKMYYSLLDYIYSSPPSF